MYLFHELKHQTSKAHHGYGEDSIGRDEAKARYQSGAGITTRIDIDSLDFSGLNNHGWSDNGTKLFTFRNALDYGVHGTVTIQRIDNATFSVLPETYNNDYKEGPGVVLAARNFATWINRLGHGDGKPFKIEFDGVRRFDSLGRKQ